MEGQRQTEGVLSVKRLRAPNTVRPSVCSEQQTHQTPESSTRHPHLRGPCGCPLSREGGWLGRDRCTGGSSLAWRGNKGSPKQTGAVPTRPVVSAVSAGSSPPLTLRARDRLGSCGWEGVVAAGGSLPGARPSQEHGRAGGPAGGQQGWAGARLWHWGGLHGSRAEGPAHTAEDQVSIPALLQHDLQSALHQTT